MQQLDVFGPCRVNILQKIIALFQVKLKTRQAVMSIVIISELVICKHLWQSELKFLKNSMKLPWVPPLSSCSNCLNILGDALRSEQGLLEFPMQEEMMGTTLSSPRMNLAALFIHSQSLLGSNSAQSPILSLPGDTGLFPAMALPAFQRTQDLACIQLILSSVTL